MERQVLADRIVTYSDAVVAFALVNGFAFLISLGEPDIRCSIANVSAVAFALNSILPVLGTYALFWLRNYQRRLHTKPTRDATIPDESEASEHESPTRAESQPDPLVAHFWHIAFVVRMTLIWVFTALVIAGIYGATLDERCLAPLQ